MSMFCDGDVCSLTARRLDQMEEEGHVGRLGNSTRPVKK